MVPASDTTKQLSSAPVVVKTSCGKEIVVKAQARPISLERERVLAYDDVASLEKRGFMIIRNNAAVRELAKRIAHHPQCDKVDKELQSTAFFTDHEVTSDLLKTMGDVLGNALGANSVELAEDITAQVRVGLSSMCSRVHRDLQSSWQPKGRGDTSHGASANVFSVWVPLADVTENQAPLGLIPTSNTFVEISSPRSARKLFRYREDRHGFDAETFTMGTHHVHKLNTLEYFPSMKPGDVLLFKSDAVFHVALSQLLSCDDEHARDCSNKYKRKFLDVKLFIS
jgi:ectoine hydroxylase-related dioxygenase (phytanoyl-CoA dioxygenase family)